MPRTSRSRRPLILLAVLCLGLAACDEAPLVADGAGLMSAEQKDRLALFHGFLLKDHDIDYRVVTGRDLGDINVFAAERFAALKIGQPGRSGRGLLLVIDAKADLVRLEVSSNLEGVYPDAFVAYVEHRQMVPFFGAGRIADGILATTELIVTRAQRAKANAGFDGEAWHGGSGGGGATAKAGIGAGVDPGFRKNGTGIAAGRTPGETLAQYFRAMARRNAAPDLDIYTPATQRMLRRWVVTPAQMDNLVRAYRRCGASETRFGPDGRRAVIRYGLKERQCAPFFFLRNADGWALDLTVMQNLIRFGRDNSWHFVARAANPYAFAFTDWRIDRRGYPRARKQR
ncbi:MAG: TPM domain-containing protein [Alphaproteobacteria bacterium]|nr:TPM domain-containing protein [Alphaproteobacteria bacterium]